MTRKEWESLCDGCGRCCLMKLEDEDTAKIYYTDIACRLFDAHTCKCGDYAHRKEKVSDCIRLTPTKLSEIKWLPPTCAYRLIDEGKDIEWWHPLVSGRPETVHEAGVSAKGRVGGKEGKIRLRDYPDHVRRWPALWPRKALTRAAGPAAGASRK